MFIYLEVFVLLLALLCAFLWQDERVGRMRVKEFERERNQERDEEFDSCVFEQDLIFILEYSICH